MLIAAAAASVRRHTEWRPQRRKLLCTHVSTVIGFIVCQKVVQPNNIIVSRGQQQVYRGLYHYYASSEYAHVSINEVACSRTRRRRGLASPRIEVDGGELLLANVDEGRRNC